MLVKEGKAATPSSDVSQGSRGGAGGDATAAVLQRKLQLQSGEALVLSSEVVELVSRGRRPKQRVARCDELGDGVQDGIVVVDDASSAYKA